MRGNPIRAAVNTGDVQYGTWINMIRNPAVLPLLKAAGLHYVRVDMEHSSPDMETIANMSLLARALDFPIVIRPPEANREWITRLLDAGVWNLHCPQVDSARQAHEIVQASRYAPWGSRGMAGRGAHTDFEAGGSQTERMQYANSEVFITVMLETKAVFDELDDIASMPGIDALTLGPTDLAQDLGVFGTPDMGPVLDEHRQKIVDAAKKYGKTTAMLCSSPAEMRKWQDAGVLLLALSSEVDVLQEGFRRAIAEVNA